jgi:type IV pilus assembly protein PilB
MLEVTRSLQQVIARNAPAQEIEAQALKEGMSTLKLSCSRHVLNGITSIGEMRKIVYEAGDII